MPDSISLMPPLFPERSDVLQIVNSIDNPQSVIPEKHMDTDVGAGFKPVPTKTR